MTTPLIALTADIARILSEATGRHGGEIAGYAARKAAELARATLLIAEAKARGAPLTAEELAEAEADLERMVARFARTLDALAAVEAEKLAARLIQRLTAALAPDPAAVG